MLERYDHLPEASSISPQGDGFIELELESVLDPEPETRTHLKSRQVFIFTSGSTVNLIEGYVVSYEAIKTAYQDQEIFARLIMKGSMVSLTTWEA